MARRVEPLKSAREYDRIQYVREAAAVLFADRSRNVSGNDRDRKKLVNSAIDDAVRLYDQLAVRGFSP
jgi:hypothetical protein